MAERRERGPIELGLFTESNSKAINNSFLGLPSHILRNQHTGL